MQRTICVRLDTTPEQAAALAATLEASRDCFNTVAAWGWACREKNGVALHNATYYPLRERHPELPAQLVISARMKATEALRSAMALEKNGKTVSAPTTERGSIRYDARSYWMCPNRTLVSLSTVAGRVQLSFKAHAHASRWLDRATGFASADLVHRPSGWWLNIVLDIRSPVVAPRGQTIGIDLGINRPVVTSEAKFLGERRWKEVDQRYFRLTRSLQAKGTKSAKRHLKKVSGRRKRFRRDCDHVLSKRVVQSVEPGSVIVVENLTDIRTKTKQRGRRQNRRLHSWSFAQLRTFLTYKAEETGCRVVAVDPRHTSQRCNRCGFVHHRNRTTQSVFRCQQCGFELNADLNAARNVAWKYQAVAGMSGDGGQSVNLPIVGGECLHSSTHKPPALAGGR